MRRNNLPSFKELIKLEKQIKILITKKTIQAKILEDIEKRYQKYLIHKKFLEDFIYYEKKIQLLYKCNFFNKLPLEAHKLISEYHNYNKEEINRFPVFGRNKSFKLKFIEFLRKQDANLRKEYNLTLKLYDLYENKFYEYEYYGYNEYKIHLDRRNTYIKNNNHKRKCYYCNFECINYCSKCYDIEELNNSDCIFYNSYNYDPNEDDYKLYKNKLNI